LTDSHFRRGNGSRLGTSAAADGFSVNFFFLVFFLAKNAAISWSPCGWTECSVKSGAPSNSSLAVGAARAAWNQWRPLDKPWWRTLLLKNASFFPAHHHTRERKQAYVDAAGACINPLDQTSTRRPSRCATQACEQGNAGEWR